MVSFELEINYAVRFLAVFFRVMTVLEEIETNIYVLGFDIHLILYLHKTSFN